MEVLSERIEIYDTTLRVLITSSDGHAQWGTVGVSANIVEASWRALVDSVESKLTRDGVLPICDEKDSDSEARAEGRMKEAIRS